MSPFFTVFFIAGLPLDAFEASKQFSVQVSEVKGSFERGFYGFAWPSPTRLRMSWEKFVANNTNLMTQISTAARKV